MIEKEKTHRVGVKVDDVKAAAVVWRVVTELSMVFALMKRVAGLIEQVNLHKERQKHGLESPAAANNMEQESEQQQTALLLLMKLNPKQRTWQDWAEVPVWNSSFCFTFTIVVCIFRRISWKKVFFKLECDTCKSTVDSS